MGMHHRWSTLFNITVFLFTILDRTSIKSRHQIFSSLFFSLQFVVNHEVDTIIDDKPHAKSIDFGQFQLEESFTFGPDSTLALELSGGLNTQIEHHLFPGVHYSHYGAISKIIRRVATRFNLDYQHSHSWWGAVKKHYNLLKNPPVSTRAKRDNMTPKIIEATTGHPANVNAEATITS